MKKTMVGALCLILLLVASPVYTSLPWEFDFKDSDYIFGMNRGDITTKYILVRNAMAKADAYVSSVLNLKANLAQNGTDQYTDYYVSSRSGRSITARKLSTAQSILVYVDAYYNADDTTRISYPSAIQNAVNGRTTGCQLSLNLAAVNHTHYSVNLTLFNEFTHILYHCLFMTKSAFSKVIDINDYAVKNPTFLSRDKIISNTDFDGTTREFWTLDNGATTANSSIITWLKATYRADVTGLLLEKHGDDAGNHPENAIYYADIAATIKTPYKYFTKLGPSLAVATGFYTMSTNSLYQFNPMPALKSATAGKLGELDPAFQTKQCLTENAQGYCTNEGEITCSQDGLYKLICKKDPVGGDCLFRSPYDICILPRTTGLETYEFYGANSRCIMVTASSAKIPACMKVNSAASGTNIIIADGTSTSTITCDGEGNSKQLPVTTGVTVTCPGGFAWLITYQSKCPLDCSGNGICLTDGAAIFNDPSCFCFTQGYSGANCATFTDYLAKPTISDPYNASGMGWVRTDFGSIQALTVSWTLFAAFWLFN